MNSEYESVWNETFVSSRKFPEETEEKPRSRSRVLNPIFSEYCVQSATTSGPALSLLSVLNDMKKSAIKYSSIYLQPGYCLMWEGQLEDACYCFGFSVFNSEIDSSQLFSPPAAFPRSPRHI